MFLFLFPDNDAALALSGGDQQILNRLNHLTGASFVMRGLDLEISGRPAQLERASALVELLRPLWEEGQAISSIDSFLKF